MPIVRKVNLVIFGGTDTSSEFGRVDETILFQQHSIGFRFPGLSE